MSQNENFIELIFGKSRFDISIVDIEDFFQTNQEESSVLEFKSGEVEIIDLYKEITAFLNTEGGLIIIGAPREQTINIGKKNVKTCMGNLTYSKFKSKDWLYQKICSNIVPAPTNLKIEEFIDDNGNIFLIDIPQSMHPPHQCSSDGKYYIRLEREAKPAPHGIIQALFNKRRVPKLNVEFKVSQLNNNIDDITLVIKNETPIPAEKVSFLVDIYNVSKVESSYRFNIVEDELGQKFTMSHSTNQILVQIINLPIHFNVQHFNKEYLIFIGFWCRDVDFECNYFTYSPYKKTLIEGSWLNGPSILEELKRINN